MNTSRSQGAWDPTVYGCVYFSLECVCLHGCVCACMYVLAHFNVYVCPGVCYVCVQMSLYMFSDCLHTSTVFMHAYKGRAYIDAAL